VPDSEVIRTCDEIKQVWFDQRRRRAARAERANPAPATKYEKVAKRRPFFVPDSEVIRTCDEIKQVWFDQRRRRAARAERANPAPATKYEEVAKRRPFFPTDQKLVFSVAGYGVIN
jgi:type IV secretory pathway VirJ component